MMTMCDDDANAILVTELKNRKSKSIADAWEHFHQTLTKHGHITKIIVLDNKYSADLKASLKKHKKNYELTLPNMHRQNAAEISIRKFKNHMMEGFATYDPHFPVEE